MALLNRTRTLTQAFVFALLVAGATIASSGPITEAQAKASLLFNLAAFVEWPPAAFGGAVPLAVCIAGDPEVLDAVARFQGRPVNGHVLAARAIGDEDDPASCHILFIADAADGASLVLRRAGGLPILTVGNGPQFLRHGGIIAILFEQSRLRFDISTANGNRARLTISSKMLGLARVVKNDAAQN